MRRVRIPSWLLEPFPGVRWTALFRFAWLPSMWVILVAAAYVWMYQTSLHPDNRWAALEVFVAIAGAGAVFAALAGLVRQFEHPQPDVRLFVVPPGVGLNGPAQWTLTLANQGRAPASRIRMLVHGFNCGEESPLNFEAVDVSDWHVSELMRSNHGGTAPWEVVTDCRMLRPLAEETPPRDLGTFRWPGDRLVVVAQVENQPGMITWNSDNGLHWAAADRL